MPLIYLNPLVCAFLFTVASLAIKRGLMEGAGATRGVFITNGVFFVTLFPLWFLVPGETDMGLVWAPVAAGVVAFLGSVFQIMALKIGDVSVATPLLGAKAIFVALFATLVLGHALPLSWWAGAMLAGAGVFFLGRSPGLPGQPARLGLTVLLSLLTVAAYALMDIFVAGWGQAFGFERFLALQQLVTFILGLGLIPFFKEPLSRVSRACWIWLVGGALLVVVQYYLLNWTISTSGNPTVVNIFYSSRGLWSVVLVWAVGSLFGNTERAMGWRVFASRIAGSALLFAAIFVVLLD